MTSVSRRTWTPRPRRYCSDSARRSNRQSLQRTHGKGETERTHAPALSPHFRFARRSDRTIIAQRPQEMRVPGCLAGAEGIIQGVTPNPARFASRSTLNCASSSAVPWSPPIRVSCFRANSMNVSASARSAWPGTRTPTKPNGWPRTRRFGCWPRAAPGDERRAHVHGAFETEVLAEERNYDGLTRLNADLIQHVAARSPSRRVTLDIDSSESPVHGTQEQSAYNGHFESVCYHPLFVFNQDGDCLAATLRSGNVPSAKGCYELLERRGVAYAIRLPANDVL